MFAGWCAQSRRLLRPNGCLHLHSTVRRTASVSTNSQPEKALLLMSETYSFLSRHRRGALFLKTDAVFSRRSSPAPPPSRLAACFSHAWGCPSLFSKFTNSFIRSRVPSFACCRLFCIKIKGASFMNPSQAPSFRGQPQQQHQVGAAAMAARRDAAFSLFFVGRIHSWLATDRCGNTYFYVVDHRLVVAETCREQSTSDREPSW